MSETDTTNGRKVRKATTQEVRKINKLLDQFCVRDSGSEEEAGDCHYINGHTDETIAKLVHPDLGGNAVSRIRREIFGNFHKEPRVRQPDAELKAKVDQQAAQIGTLATALLNVSIVLNRYMADIGEDQRAVSTAWEQKLWAAVPPSDAPPPAEDVA